MNPMRNGRGKTAKTTHCDLCGATVSISAITNHRDAGPCMVRANVRKMEREGMLTVLDERNALFMRQVGVPTVFGLAHYQAGSRGKRALVCSKWFAPAWAILVFTLTGGIEPERDENYHAGVRIDPVTGEETHPKQRRRTKTELTNIREMRKRMLHACSSKPDKGDALVAAHALGGAKAAWALFPEEDFSKVREARDDIAF